MGKKMIIAAICFVVLVIICIWVLRPTSPVNFTVPQPSLEKTVCDKVSAEIGDCKRILLFDRDSNLVFVEASEGIVPVRTNESFTKVQNIIFPIMDFAEFKEEHSDRGPIDWRVATDIDGKSSFIYGFAEDEAKTIVINREGKIQPNKFYIRDHLSVWYVLIDKPEITLPLDVSVYDNNGQKIDAGFEE
ncbi:hypothetical protein [Bacillus andreraoultii]|uniref:hypothetical protein n=1 Tax=Bacillus andreraoultii TaxID=1499685 RepID=UPI00053A1EBB|nr:hypothetical protein [Bacillus andreraoultii]